MSFIALASNVRWTSEKPPIYVNFSYEKERSGADMRYRVRVTVNALTGASSFGYPIYVQASINGTALSASTIKASSPSQWSSALTYTSAWVTVSNKSSGTTPVSFRVYSGSGSSRTQTNSYSMEIDPGASGISLSADSIEFGGSITATVTPYIDGATHRITYSLSGSEHSSTIDIPSGTTNTFTVPMSWINGIPDSVTGTVTVSLETFNGETSIGVNTASFTVSVPDSVVPTISAAELTLTDGFGTYALQNRTSGKITVSAAGAYGSSISTYIATGIATAVTNEITLPVFQSSGSQTINVYVYDSRGRRSLDYPVTVQVFSNDNPTLNATVTRCLADGTVDTDGQYIKIYATFSCIDIAGTNTVACKEKHRKAGTDTWSSETVVQNNAYTITGNNLITQADDYEILITATDTKGTSTSVEIDVAKSFRLINFNGPIGSIGIGRMASKSKTLQVALKTEFDGDVDVAGDFTINGEPLPEVEYPISIANGGTGAESAADAMTNLGNADYIIEEGDSGIWHYRKWNLGFAECWGRTSKTSAALRSWGSIYTAGNSASSTVSTDVVAYPIEFIEEPSVYPSIYQNGNWTLGILLWTVGTVTKCPAYTLWRPASASSQFTWGINMYVRGKWK